MQLEKCSNCGLPFESGGNSPAGLHKKCPHCGHSRLPPAPGTGFIDRLRVETRPHDPFKSGLLGPESLLSKLALMSFFSAVISAWSAELRYFTLVAFFGFIMFGSLYWFLRMRSS